MKGDQHMTGFHLPPCSVGFMFRESPDGKWTRDGKLLTLRPIFTRKPGGFMVSLVAWRYCVGVAVMWWRV